MIQLKNNPVIPEGMTRAEMREAVKQAGYTDEKFCATVVTVSSYCISIALQMLYEQVKADCQELRKHPLCTFQGYKNELRKVEAENERIIGLQNFLIRDTKERIRIIAREQQEYSDIPATARQMLYAVQNHLYRNRVPDAKLFSYAVHAQALADYVVQIVVHRIRETEQYRPGFSRAMMVAPKHLNELLCQLIDRMLKLTGTDPELNGDSITQNREICTCLQLIDSGIHNVNNLEMNTAFALQELHGEQWLKENDLHTYYLLHPMESPEYKARKEAEAAQAERDRQERERIDRELAEAEAARRAEEERDIADRLRDAGWNIKKH